MRKVLIALAVFVALLLAGTSWNLFNLVDGGPHYVPNPSGFNLPKGQSFPTTTSDNKHWPIGFNNGSGTATTGNSSYSPQELLQSTWGKQWVSVGGVAWQFYKPGIGVSPTTGLIYASEYWHRFTDWDLAGYIQATLSAERLGIIGAGGQWGSEYRLNLVLNFLVNRPLTTDKLPFQFYDSDTGTLSLDMPSNTGNPSDEGRLLIALYDAELLHPDLTSTIQQAINKVNYTLMVTSNSDFFSSTSPYAQYCSMGFALWNLAKPTNQTGTSIQPGAMLVPEPILLSILENVDDPWMAQAGQEVYSASNTMYNRTGQLVAFGEGGYPSIDGQSSPYIYEAISVPDGSTYKISLWQGPLLSIPPAAFTKTGFAFLAIFKSTYGMILVNNLGGLVSQNGYMDGIISSTNTTLNSVSDNTNNMIMEASAYAVYTA